MNDVKTPADAWSTAMLEGALDLVCMGIALSRKSGELMYANRFAGELLRAHGLAEPVGAAADERWQTCLRGGLLRVVRQLGSLCETWSSANGQLLIQILPVRPADPHCHMLGRRGGAMLMMQERGRHQLPTPEQLKVLFGLTAAESRTCLLLCQVDSAQECARQMHVSIATVRSQLQAAMHKTATVKQAELLSVIFSVPVGRPEAGGPDRPD